MAAIRWAFVLILAVALAWIVAVFVFQPDASVPYDQFEPRVRRAFERAGFSENLEASANGGNVSLPLTIEWHPRRWRLPKGFEFRSGFSDDAILYKVERAPALEMSCYARFFDSRAQLIEIRAKRDQMLAAAELRSALEREFPRLPIRIRTP